MQKTYIVNLSTLSDVSFNANEVDRLVLDTTLIWEKGQELQAGIVLTDNTFVAWNDIDDSYLSPYSQGSITTTNIPNNAFYNIKNIKKIIIPNTILNIGEGSFMYSSNIVEVNFEENSQVTSIRASAFAYCTSLIGMIIPNSVTVIEPGAFAYCHNITNMIISNNITSISIETFRFCSFTSVAIPNGVINIGQNAFYECDSLENIVIPSSVTDIGNQAFIYCNSLTDVYYTGTQAEWQQISIGSGNEYLLNATIHFNYSGENI